MYSKQRPPTSLPPASCNAAGFSAARFLCVLSQIELNRPMKGVPFRRANHAELKSKIAPLGLGPNPVASCGASSGPKRKAGILVLVRVRSLGATILRGKTPCFSLWCSLCFGHSSGRGARIKTLRGTSYYTMLCSYGNLSKRIDPIGRVCHRKPGSEVPAWSKIGRLA